MFGLLKFSKSLFCSSTASGDATNVAKTGYLKRGLIFVDWKIRPPKKLEWRKKKDLSTAHLFQRGQRGLYGGKRIGTGNNVSFSERKTRRTWKPNVQKKQLWSELQQRFLKIRLTTYVLRWIDRVGGLDNYLLYTKPRKIASDFGMRLRQDLIQVWEKKEWKDI